MSEVNIQIFHHPDRSFVLNLTLTDKHTIQRNCVLGLQAFTYISISHPSALQSQFVQKNQDERVAEVRESILYSQ